MTAKAWAKELRIAFNPKRSGDDDKLCSACERQLDPIGPYRWIPALRWLIQRNAFCPLCEAILEAFQCSSRTAWIIKHMRTCNEQQFGINSLYCSVTDLLFFSRQDQKGTPLISNTARDLIQDARVPISEIRSWIDSCVEDHGQICAPVDVWIFRAGRSPALQLILIDVRDQRVTAIDFNARYYALSYVWGQVSPLTLTTINRTTLEQHGSLSRHKDTIPTVILDAMKLVAGLGERYLWVDSLCIVQDDPKSKHQQISHMDAIYAGAICTIIALTGQHANMPLSGFGTDRRFDHDRSIEVAPNLYVKRTFSINGEVSTSYYNGRAWTFQERLLSKRCLYFGNDRVYFQCVSSLKEEDTPRRHRLRQDLSPRWDHRLNPLAAALRHEPLTSESWFHRYCSLVEQYTTKNLSYSSDIGNAFAGISAVFESVFQTTLVHGIPEAFFDVALLWVPNNKRLQQRPNANGSYFPSWSWMGWIGVISPAQFGPSMFPDFRSCVKEFRVGDSTDSRVIPRDVMIQADPALPDEPKHAFATEADAPRTSTALRSMSLPDGPDVVIQFWASSASFSLVKNHPPSSWATYPFEYQLEILDPDGRCCGLVYDHGLDCTTSISSELILLSKWRGVGSIDTIFTRPWIEYYDVGLYDEIFYGDTPWDLLNVMVIQRVGNGARRVGLGQIHGRAWRAAKPQLKFINLI